MTVQVYGLQYLVDSQGAEKVSSLLSTFKCSADPELEVFLRKIAPKHEAKDISRTYVAVDTEKSKIKGYFTLAMKCLALDEPKAIPDKIYEAMNANRNIAQAYLIGQLAKADGVEKGFGKMMISLALEIFARGRNMFGCHLVRLDCKDELLEYYESCGFFNIGKNRNGTLNQMIQII